MKTLKIFIVAILIIIVAIAFLNPTNTDFLNFCRANRLEKGGRISYYFVYSNYQTDRVEEIWNNIPHGTRSKYLGFCKNFYLIEKIKF